MFQFYAGSAVRSGSGAERQVNGRRNMNGSAQRVIQKTSTMHISKNTSARENGSEAPTSYPKCDFSSPLSLSLPKFFLLCLSRCMSLYVHTYVSVSFLVFVSVCRPQGHVPFSLVYGNPSSRAKSKPWLTAPSP